MKREKMKKKKKMVTREWPNTQIALIFSLLLTFFPSHSQALSFTYNGFRSSATNLTLDGIAGVTPSGLLELTNSTKQETGHAFYPSPVAIKATNDSDAVSFSVTFVFAIVSQYPTLSGHGIAFVLSPTRGLPGALPSQYLGLFNGTDNGNATNHVVAVELDTIYSSEFGDINDNHVGIDINGLRSVSSFPAGYWDNSRSKFTNLSLISGKPMQVWVDYDGVKKQINVTLGGFGLDKPEIPVLSLTKNLSPYLVNSMYAGFSSSTGSVLTSHYVLGWSFSTDGPAQPLNLGQLPKLPRIGPKKVPKWKTVGLPVVGASLALSLALVVAYVIRRKKKFAEVLEDWERDYKTQRLKYKDLYFATKGFRDKELLGKGGFGRVYRGILPSSKIEVAVKRVSHESRQGMREFVSEIVSIGRLRHRHLVQLLGYCRRKDELLLVYDYMPNGSLDKYLYDQPNVTLNWSQRFRVIKGVALGLNYLHEEWEQVVIHRDVKASNVLLDGELNGRLGDFGLARLYDHGTDPQTTHVVGTLGYLAPEHTRTGKATTSTDVFSFGAFLLEVACGRRPIELRGPNEDVILVDWVYSLWARGEILEARDPNLGPDFVADEVDLVLKLGLLCSNLDAKSRPSMRQVVQFLQKDVPLPQLTSALELGASGLTFANHEGFDDYAFSYPSGLSYTSNSVGGRGINHSRASSGIESILSGGR